MPDVRTQSRGSAPSHCYDDAPDTDAAFRRIAALPDGPERSALRQEVVCAWMSMAVRLARRFRHRGETFEDLTQVAQFGLAKAVSRFDPSRGTAFPSFAVPTILGEVKRHFRDHLWGVQELRGRVRSAGHECALLYGREPSVHEIAAHTGLTEAEVRLGQEALESFTARSPVPGPRTPYPAAPSTATHGPTPSVAWSRAST